jgi:hypothetical protein
MAAAAKSVSGEDDTNSSGGRRNRPKLEVAPFIRSTYSILDSQAGEDNAKYIKWNTDGTALHIVDEHGFAKEVLPRFFKHSNISSFIRQLNIYGFNKTKQDPQWKEFKNPNFKRGCPHLLSNIHRRTTAGKGKKRGGTAEVEKVLAAQKLKANDQLEFKKLLEDMKEMKSVSEKLARRLRGVETENRALQQKYRSKTLQTEKIKLRLEQATKEREAASRERDRISNRFQKMSTQVHKMYLFMCMVYQKGGDGNRGSLHYNPGESSSSARTVTRQHSLNDYLSNGLLKNAPVLPFHQDDDDKEGVEFNAVDGLDDDSPGMFDVDDPLSSPPSLRRGNSFQSIPDANISSISSIGTGGSATGSTRGSSSVLGKRTRPPAAIEDTDRLLSVGSSIGSFEYDNLRENFNSKARNATQRMNSVEESLGRITGGEGRYDNARLFDDGDASLLEEFDTPSF